MNRIGTMILTVVLFAIGIIIVFLNPLSPVSISFGMFLVAVSILSVAIQVYFPAAPLRPVELRVVKRRVRPKPRKRLARKSKRRVKKAKKTRKKRR